MKKWAYLIATFSGLIFSNFSASALTINPARLTVTIAKGDSQVISLLVRNDSKETKNYILGVVGVEQDVGGRPIFRLGASDAEAWVLPDKSEVAIAPGKTQTVYFTAKVPDTAATGVSHFVGLSVGEFTTSTSGVGISGKVVSLVDLQVAGFITEHGVLNLWRAKNIFSGDLSWPMNVVIVNNGTGSAPLKGSVTIRNLLTQKTSTDKISLGSLLLPGTSRQITVDYRAPDNFGAGIYAVKLDVVYGYTGQQLSRTSYVLYLPKYAQLILFVFFAGIIFGVFKFKKKSAV